MKKKVSEKQVAGLKDYAKEKNVTTIEKVNKTIDAMKRKGMQINFETVSKESGVSRATLYNNPQLKERILSLRALTKRLGDGETPVVIKDKSQLQEEKIHALRERIKTLEAEKKALILQLVDYEELKKELDRFKRHGTFV